eukprot:gene15827-7146_t
MFSSDTSYCSNYSDSSAAATFYSSGWPYSYYASSTPCWRRYYAGNNPVRVAVMDVSLYRTSSVYCYTTDSYFEVKASSTVYTTSSSITSYATTVSGRICGIKTPTVYTAKNKYVYLLLNRPHTFSGYRGVIVGYMAYDLNECRRGTHRCSSNALCTNTIGSYRCYCKSGYIGTGFSCLELLLNVKAINVMETGYEWRLIVINDANECSQGTHRCSANALCINTVGSYRCACKSGYKGTGSSCEAADDVASSKTVASKDSSSSTDLGKAIGGSMAGLVLVLGIIAELVHLRRKGSRNSEQNQASLRTQGDEPGARYNAASNNHDDGQVEIQSDPSNSVKYKTKCDSPARQQKV